MLHLLSTSFLLCAVVRPFLTQAHDSHSNPPSSDDWATVHLAEEHHIDNFDPGAFFSLHDFDSNGVWDVSEVSRFYGLNDESLASVSHERKAEVVRSVMNLFDPAKTGQITRDEWMRLSVAGVRLPDFGLGPGHHGDDEYEYEIHHFEKYHDENTREEDLIHEEDKAHFRKHELMEAEQERIELEQQKPIVEANIPSMFRKQL